jgi:hypothetical protein
MIRDIVAGFMGMVKKIEQEGQADPCQSCQFHVGWTRGGWCYMFKERQEGCQKFLDRVYPPYRNEPMTPPNNGLNQTTKGGSKNRA